MYNWLRRLDMWLFSPPHTLESVLQQIITVLKTSGQSEFVSDETAPLPQPEPPDQLASRQPEQEEQI